MSDDFLVKFWGVRGSHPVPGLRTRRFGGNTACVEIQCGGASLILDAGTGIIPLGRELIKRSKADGSAIEPILLLSHLHHDHIQGFPFFGPAYLPHTRISIFGPGDSNEVLKRVLEANQSQPIFPVGFNEMAASKEVRALRESEALLVDDDGIRVGVPGDEVAGDTLRVRVLRSYAHPGGVHVYRVEWHGHSLVYATDTEGYVGIDRRLLAFAHGADLLIHDAQYSESHYRGLAPGLPSTQGYGHSTAEMACELACAAGVGRLVLFHHDPNYDDESVAEGEARARKYFAHTLAASEGLELSAGNPDSAASFLYPTALERDVKYVQHG